VSRSSRHRAFDRSVERSTIASLVPVLALVPVWLVALAVFWFPIHFVWHIPFWMFALLHLVLVVLMFWRPLQTVLVMRLLGARGATSEEAHLLEPAWRSVAQQLRINPRRYSLAVLESDELNAFACGGSLLVVTSYAIDALPRDEMTGVLAHELAHHLGFHTAALAVRQWLSIPIYLLAGIGFFLQNVATAATRSYVSHSSALTAVGRLVSGILSVVAWAFLSALLVSNRIANKVGRRSEFEADRRAVAMGFGRELSTALRRVEATEAPRDGNSLRDSLVVTHPSARSRVMRIDAFRRQPLGHDRLRRGAI